LAIREKERDGIFGLAISAFTLDLQNGAKVT
jgi:hypothetical protein